MAHFIIAGKAGDPELAKAEMLGHYLQKNLPDFHITIDFKREQEWDSFVHSIYEQKRWGDRMASDRTIKPESELSQLIYRPSGELIGNTKDFVGWVKHGYNFELDVDQTLLSEVAKENLDKIQ